jgi:hypothetical protein
MIFTLMPMAFVVNASLIWLQPPLVSVQLTVPHAVDFRHRREPFPPFAAPNVIPRPMDNPVGPNNLSAPAILLRDTMNAPFKIRLNGQQSAIVIPLDFRSVSLAILK